jgi:hypothetical protein
MAAQGRRCCWQSADMLAQCHSEFGRGVRLVLRSGHVICERYPWGPRGASVCAQPASLLAAPQWRCYD